MEDNVVIMNLGRYEELKKAEEKLNEPKSKSIIIKESIWYGDFYQVQTDDETVEKLAEELKESLATISRLENELGDQKRELKNYKECLKEAYGMTYWKFRKFRKKIFNLICDEK